MAKAVDTVASLSTSVCSTFTDSTDHGSKMFEKKNSKKEIISRVRPHDQKVFNFEIKVLTKRTSKDQR